MSGIAPCLNSRYQALDQLISDLNDSAVGDPSVKLMCSIWKALQEETPQESTTSQEPCYYMQPQSQPYKPKVYGNPLFVYTAKSTRSPSYSSPNPPGDGATSVPPLSKALNSLQEAASFDQSCNAKLEQLLEVETKLQDQISKLEQKEQVGINLLKEADVMWKDMEETYKKKIAASLERQVVLVSQLQEIEKSAAKWRKNKKELESQLETIAKCQREILDKTNQKKNDLKVVEGDIASINNKIKKTQGEIEAAKASVVNKKKLSDGRITKETQQLTKLQKEVAEENKRKGEKEKEAREFIKAAREDLKQMCKLLMQKQLEVEDRLAEKNGIIEECNMLKDTADVCQDRCKTREANIKQEINKVDQEIQEYKLKCERCNVCIDAEDIRKFCIDCPRCQVMRQCMVKGDGEDPCTADPNEECVCLPVKKKFLDNVFENMYTVLAKRMSTPGGKKIAEDILNCLKNSRNGKLDIPTRKSLKEFVLCFVKKNLNLTIVGGAIKTRCEMDDKTYNQLMLCLKTVVVSKMLKVEKGTDPKKPPCIRWPESIECNCPKGPKDCVCTKKAPPPIDDPAYFPPEPPQEENYDVKCPVHKEKVCGADCAAYAADKIGAEVANKRAIPCYGGSGSARAAQTELKPAQPVTSGSSCMLCVCGSANKDKRLLLQRQQIIQQAFCENNRKTYRNNLNVETVSNVSKDIVLEGCNKWEAVSFHATTDAGTDIKSLPYKIGKTPSKFQSHQDQNSRPYRKWENGGRPSELANPNNIIIIPDESRDSQEYRNSRCSPKEPFYKTAFGNEQTNKYFNCNVELPTIVRVEENRVITNILNDDRISLKDKEALINELLSKNDRKYS